MQAFKKILKDNFLPFIYTSTLTGSVFMGYISYKIQKNKKQYELNIDNDRMKDTTRLSYDFYGINWGVASDDMIKEKLDSGDALFVKYECNECINLTDFFNCQYLHFKNSEQNYDNLALLFRNSEDDVYVFYDDFGKIEKLRYNEFLSFPYLKEVSLRKISYQEENGKISKRIYKTLKEMDPNVENKTMFVEKSFADSIFKHFLKNADILSFDVTNMKSQEFINILDNVKPVFFKPEFKLNNKIIIRSKINRELFSY